MAREQTCGAGCNYDKPDPVVVAVGNDCMDTIGRAVDTHGAVEAGGCADAFLVTRSAVAGQSGALACAQVQRANAVIVRVADDELAPIPRDGDAVRILEDGARAHTVAEAV